jgi:hypothetical protein
MLCISPLSIWLSQVTSYEIRGGRSGTQTDLPPDLLGLPLVIAIIPLIHTHLSQLSEACDTPNQAAHYHILGLFSWLLNCQRVQKLAFQKNIILKHAGPPTSTIGSRTNGMFFSHFLPNIQ